MNTDLIGTDYSHIISKLVEDEDVFKNQYKIEIRDSINDRHTVGLIRFDKAEFRQYKLMVLV